MPEPADKRRKKSFRAPNAPRGRWKKPLFIGLALLLVCGGGFGTVAYISAHSNQIDLSYLPEDTKIVHFIRVSNAVDQPSFERRAAKHSRIKTGLDRLQRQTGIDPKSVESITLGYPDRVAKDVLTRSGWTMANLSDKQFIGVARMHDTFDNASLLKWLGRPEAKKHGEIDLYEFAKNYAVCFPDDETVVFGALDLVKAALDRDGEEFRLPAFDVIDPDDDYTVAIDLDLSDADEVPIVLQQRRVTDAVSYAVASRFGKELRRTERIDAGSSSNASAHIPPMFDQKRHEWYTEGSVLIYSFSGWSYAMSENATEMLLTVASNANFDPLHSVLVDLESGSENAIRQAASRLIWDQPGVSAERIKELTDAAVDAIDRAEEGGKVALLRAIGKHGGGEHASRLLRLLDEDSTTLRRQCFTTLGKVGTAKEVPKIATFLDIEEDVSAARYCLQQIAEGVEDEALLYLKSENAYARRAACDLLAAVGTETSIADLETLQDDRELQQRARGAIYAIRRRAEKPSR